MSELASLPADEWLTIFAAARLAKCARATLTAAIRRGELPGYCKRCHRHAGVKDLQGGHMCPKALPGRTGRYPLVVRRRDLEKFSVSEAHRAAGLKSARSRKNA